MAEPPPQRALNQFVVFLADTTGLPYDVAYVVMRQTIWLYELDALGEWSDILTRAGPSDAGIKAALYREIDNRRGQFPLDVGAFMWYPRLHTVGNMLLVQFPKILGWIADYSCRSSRRVGLFDRMDEQKFTARCELMVNNHHLRELQFSDDAVLTNGFVEILARYTSRMPKLKTLWFKNLPSDTNIHLLLERPTFLESLTISHNEPTDDALIRIATALRENRTLIEFSFEKLRDGDVGINALLDAVRGNTVLKGISISYGYDRELSAAEQALRRVYTIYL